MCYRLPSLAVLAGALLLPTCNAVAEPLFRRSFDGPETSWQLLDSQAVARVVAHEVIPGAGREGDAAERIVAVAPAGQSLLLITPTAPTAVLDETGIRLWLHASRPDVQLAARVRLPHTTDSGEEAATVMVRGTRYRRAGQWQELVLHGVPKLVSGQVRVMRASPGRSIDAREAYIDAVVLVVPGEPSGVEVVTDELRVDGILKPGAEILPVGYTVATSATEPAAVASPVKLQGGTLHVNDEPFVPRGIRWQGEPLEFLAARGFNVVQLPRPPTDAQIVEAQRHGIWFLSVPPRPERLAETPRLGRAGDRVLAWHLHDEAVEVDPHLPRRWGELVRQRDVVSGRPLIVSAEIEPAAADHVVDVRLLRHPFGGAVSPVRFDGWVEQRRRMMPPGRPLWSIFATHYDEAVARQCATLSGVESPPPNVAAQRLESLVQLACTRGARGFLFESYSSLAETDVAARQRAVVAELINHRLRLIEPWLAAGHAVARIASSDGAWSGVVLHVDQARLLIPIAMSDGNDAQSAGAERQIRSAPAGRQSAAEVEFVVPGLSPSSQAFVLTPASLRALPVQRVAGGVRLTLPPTGDAFVLITEDGRTIQNLRQHVASGAARIVRLQRDLAAQRAAMVGDTGGRLAQLGHQLDATADNLAWANQQLAQVDSLIAAGRLEHAQQAVASARDALEQAAAEQRATVVAAGRLESNPLELADELLAAYAAFERGAAARQLGENLLYGGDFEDLDQMTSFGWRHLRHPQPGLETRAALSASQPQQGRFSLELQTLAGTSTESARPTWTAVPLWIESPRIPVSAGQIVEISGWVRIDEPIAGGEGLQIVDSLGGPELALAVRETAGWQPFRMIRAAAAATELRLTLALSGLGTAHLDAVMIRAVEQATPPLQ